jgi:hypothetical protein
VSGLKGLSFVGGNLVSFLSELDHILALVSCSKFTKVPEVVTLHLHEEHSGLWVLGVGNQRVV